MFLCVIKIRFHKEFAIQTRGFLVLRSAIVTALGGSQIGSLIPDADARNGRTTVCSITWFATKFGVLKVI